MLPITLSHLELAVGFIIGCIVIIVLTKVVKERSRYLAALCIFFVLFGAIVLNLYNIIDQFPPYVVTEPGDLMALGEKRWPAEPFEFYHFSHQQYLSNPVYVNPKFFDIVDIHRIEEFGVNLKRTKNVPYIISDILFSRINRLDNFEWDTYVYDGVEYRFYKVDDQNDEILLAVFDDKVLFIPKSLGE